MPYPSIDLLAAAAADLTDRHPLSVITIPALLRTAHKTNTSPLELLPFGSKAEREDLEAFRVSQNDRTKPYLAAWGDPPQLVNADYCGSTLQRFRTQDSLGRSILNDDYSPQTGKRKKFSLKPDAGAIFAQSKYAKVNKLSLAAWLGRRLPFTHVDELMAWFDETYPLEGTDLDHIYTADDAAATFSIEHPLSDAIPSNSQILRRFGLNFKESPAATNKEYTEVSSPSESSTGLTWTQEFTHYPLRITEIDEISDRALKDLQKQHIEFPESAQIVHRSVVALLVGNLILKGPPGTGKTSLARALARAFRSHLLETTATSDWSPFHVVGGLRPNTAGGLSPVQGKFTAAAEECAEFVRTDVNDPERADLFTQTDPESRSQAAWLLIDELNRADIDKSIGSLFTVLSSCDPDHLSKTPIDLWFEPEPTRQRLWVPARFRIIGAMNDFDTSFVNTISQGLSRRFQFVTVPAPTIQATTENPVTTELENAFLGAFAWLDRTYGGTFSLPSSDEIRESLQDCLSLLQKVLDGLRQPSNVGGWPVGTAQAVDMLRVIILQTTSRGHYRNTYELLDLAIADRLIPQMAGINDDQIDEFTTLWSELGLKEATRAMQHVVDPHGMDLS